MEDISSHINVKPTVSPDLEKSAGHVARAIIAATILVVLGFFLQFMLLGTVAKAHPTFGLLFLVDTIVLGMLVYQFAKRSLNAGTALFVLYFLSCAVSLIIAWLASITPLMVAAIVFMVLMSAFMVLGLSGLGHLNDSDQADAPGASTPSTKPHKIAMLLAVILTLTLLAILFGVASDPGMLTVEVPKQPDV